MKLLEPKYRRLMRALAIPAILIFVLSRYRHGDGPYGPVL